MFKRNILPSVLEILRDFGKMAFVSGPRQVGKTTLARQVLAAFPYGRLLQLDSPAHQAQLVKDPAFFEREKTEVSKEFLVVFDEIHKFRDGRIISREHSISFTRIFPFSLRGAAAWIFSKGAEIVFWEGIFNSLCFPLLWAN